MRAEELELFGEYLKHDRKIEMEVNLVELHEGWREMGGGGLIIIRTLSGSGTSLANEIGSWNEMGGVVLVGLLDIISSKNLNGKKES